MIRILKFIGTTVLLTGIAFALLKAFGGDPFAILEWAGSWFLEAVTRIADWLSGNSTFQKVTEAP